MTAKIWIPVLGAGLSGAIVLGLAVSRPEPVAAATSCESLSTLTLPNTTITMAQTVAPAAAPPAAPAAPARGGRGNAAPVPAYCRVAATIKPTPASDIKIEVWMPMTNWNGKFQGIGNGGWSGSINAGELGNGVRAGYATAATDTGHNGGADVLLGQPEKVIDFGHRAVHEMTVKGKEITKAFYGDPAKYAYWNGCSAGGKQGLKEAQKYPEDYNGIIAGAPGVNWTGRAMGAVWIGQAQHKDEAANVPTAKFPMIHDAVLAACDALDGVTDRVLENPKACKFDPKSIQCTGADGPTCLTAAQVETVKKIYSPVINVRTKQEVFPGMEMGSEVGWTTMGGAQPFGVGVDLFRYIVFQNAAWDYKTFDWDGDIEKTLKADNNNMNALDPNLRAFYARGGKILQYHGWTDPQIVPSSSVAYYKSVLDTLGASAKVQDSHRLFMVPGMNHCQGGDGPDTFDKLGTLEKWVEKGIAPDQIVATHTASGRTRPLCPYPQVATYKGSGDTNVAESFVCK